MLLKTALTSSRCACVSLLSVALLLAACSDTDTDTRTDTSPSATGTGSSTAVEKPAPPAEPSDGAAAETATGTATPSSAAEQPAEDPAPQPVEEPGAPAPAGANVVLVFAEWDAGTQTVDAGGYVSSVVEDGGDCTLTLTRDGDEVSVSVPGVADASTTQCGGLSVAGSELGSGTWSAVLDYQPVDAPSGSSAPVEVIVP